jgi:hypothetical protein
LQVVYQAPDVHRAHVANSKHASDLNRCSASDGDRTNLSCGLNTCDGHNDRQQDRDCANLTLSLHASEFDVARTRDGNGAELACCADACYDCCCPCRYDYSADFPDCFNARDWNIGICTDCGRADLAGSLHARGKYVGRARDGDCANGASGFDPCDLYRGPSGYGNRSNCAGSLYARREDSRSARDRNRTHLS